MNAKYRKRLSKFERKITIRCRINAVGRRAIETKYLGSNTAVQRQGRTGNSSRSERRNTEPHVAVVQPGDVALHHADVSEQPMSDQHRLGTLKMGIRGHHRIARLLRQLNESGAPLSHQVRTQVNA